MKRPNEVMFATSGRNEAHLPSGAPPATRVRAPRHGQSAVRRVMASHQPLAIAQGPQWNLLPNAAFASLVGAPRRWCGRPLSLDDAYPELAPWLEPLLQHAHRDGGPAASEDNLVCVYRNGHAEETYLSAHCRRIANVEQDVPGVLVTLHESTVRVLEARRTAAVRAIAAAADDARGVAERCIRALTALGRHVEELPFALLYLKAGDGTARLTAAAHLTPGGCASPTVLSLSSAAEQAAWPVAHVLARNETLVVTDLRERFGTLPAGGWPFAPRCALVVPVSSAGRDTPEAALVTGVSARRGLDLAHRAFVELIAEQLGEVIADGRDQEDAARFAGALEERTRLARELHDTLLQDVTAIAYHLRAMLPQLDPSLRPAVELGKIVALAEHTSREARQAVWDIRPGARSSADFARAVEVGVARLVAGAGIEARVVVSGRARRLSSEQQDVVVRVTQEAVANVVRHAGASAVSTQLRYGTRQLTVTVSDNGAGFHVSSGLPTRAGHFGLVGMHERAQRVGGSLEVQSAPRAGTTVCLIVPYERRSDSESA